MVTPVQTAARRRQVCATSSPTNETLRCRPNSHQRARLRFEATAWLALFTPVRIPTAVCSRVHLGPGGA